MSTQSSLDFTPRPHLKDSALKALALLRAAGHLGVTSGQFAEARILAHSQRMGELRRAGYEILREPVRDSRCYRFWLVGEPK